jgi:16S rRNA G966 N2-methylase RsmD
MEMISGTKYGNFNKSNQTYKNKNNLSLKKLIFPPLNDDKLNQLMIDEESIKYITFWNSAQEITNIIMNYLNDFPSPVVSKSKKWAAMPLAKRMKKLVITEMTAGVGGNVLNFAKYFKYVNAIEIDNVRYNYLQRNIKIYGFYNVNCYNNDSIELLINGDDLVQDIIFFDPPWGGRGYKQYDNLRLKFGDYSIENICKILFQRERNKLIVMKLPNNYDFNYLEEELRDYGLVCLHLERMTIVLVKNYESDNIF